MQFRECVVGSLHAEFNSVNFFVTTFTLLTLAGSRTKLFLW